MSASSLKVSINASQAKVTNTEVPSTILQFLFRLIILTKLQACLCFRIMEKKLPSNKLVKVFTQV